MLLALVLPAALKLVVLMDYVIDYDTYVSVLCENRDNPRSSCNGQCHLKKQLDAVDQKEEESQAPSAPSFSSYELTFIVQPAQLPVLRWLQGLSAAPFIGEVDWINPSIAVPTAPPRFLS